MYKESDLIAVYNEIRTTRRSSLDAESIKDAI